MSGATYKIEIRHDPHSDLMPWDAYIYSVSKGESMHVGRVSGITRDEAADLARAWIARESARQNGVTLYVDDSGYDADPLHSVKV